MKFDAYNHNGNECIVKWTNSFIEVSTVLERNAREHQASFVLFTGDVRPDKTELDDKKRLQKAYEEIQGSTYNFRVLTLDGVDSDEDGMRPREWDNELKEWKFSENSVPAGARAFNGFKYGDLPTNYILGDTKSYRQRVGEEDIPFATTLNLDTEFPYAEYYKNDQTKKWVRRISSAALDKQIFPVYTSMEGMTKNVHDLTDEDMKGITFQVIPQFYWKYDQEYNNYMIHPVGMLAPTNPDLQIYDMIGNVWELVRDDWTENVSQMYDWQNPIYMNSSNNHTTKTIKGGAFDQLARRVLASSREGINVDSCQSSHASQANVGFRPSVTFTEERQLDVQTTDITNTSDIDLFFLFDASASQNNQINDMVDQAKQIVNLFAGDSLHKDRCHVGSALFLGSTIKFMCAANVAQDTQTMFWETEYTTHTTYGCGGDMYIGVSNCPYIVKDSEGREIVADSDDEWIGGGSVRTTTIKKDYTDWIKGNTPDLFSNQKNVSGQKSGLLTKFKHYKDNTWMKNAKGQSTRSPSLDMAMRDGPGGGSSTPSGSGATTSSSPGNYSSRYATHRFQKWTKDLYMLCGVPAWIEDTGNKQTLRFGKVLPTANTT